MAFIETCPKSESACQCYNLFIGDRQSEGKALADDAEINVAFIQAHGSGVAISCAHRKVSHNIMLSSYLERGQRKSCPGADICHHEVSTARYSAMCFACMEETSWRCRWVRAQVKSSGTPVPTVPCLHGRHGNCTAGMGIARLAPLGIAR